jgi:hypothetical protein
VHEKKKMRAENICFSSAASPPPPSLVRRDEWVGSPRWILDFSSTRIWQKSKYYALGALFCPRGREGVSSGEESGRVRKGLAYVLSEPDGWDLGTPLPGFTVQLSGLVELQIAVCSAMMGKGR